MEQKPRQAKFMQIRTRMDHGTDIYWERIVDINT